MKILVLLFYYNRPRMVKNALQSLKETTHLDWECAFIDDGSEHSGRPIVEEYFKDDPEFLSKIKFYHTGDTRETKLARGQSIFGQFANLAIRESDAELGIMLCDDDALYSDYLEKISVYFESNSEVVYAYSHMILFNPLVETLDDVKTRTEASPYLNWTHPLNPHCQVDSSQVAWRLSCNKEGNIWFPFPLTSNLDANLYSGLHSVYGLCGFTGFIAQFKGWGEFQLGHHSGYDRVD